MPSHSGKKSSGSHLSSPEPAHRSRSPLRRLENLFRKSVKPMEGSEEDDKVEDRETRSVKRVHFRLL